MLPGRHCVHRGDRENEAVHPELSESRIGGSHREHCSLNVPCPGARSSTCAYARAVPAGPDAPGLVHQYPQARKARDSPAGPEVRRRLRARSPLAPRGARGDWAKSTARRLWSATFALLTALSSAELPTLPAGSIRRFAAPANPVEGPSSATTSAAIERRMGRRPPVPFDSLNNQAGTALPSAYSAKPPTTLRLGCALVQSHGSSAARPHSGSILSGEIGDDRGVRVGDTPPAPHRGRQRPS